jgi:hypothetical protein
VDAGIAALISTIVGGLIGFLSSYLSSRQIQQHSRAQATYPKQLDSAEYVAMVLFRTMSGEELSKGIMDRYISACFWLPKEIREKCLSVLGNENDIKSIKTAQEMVLKHINSMIGG